jgi:nitrate/nitrite-specific signal transduction histidine kinase
MVAMRERAELLHAELEFAKPATGGAVVRLNVPLAEEVAHEQ